MSTPLSTPVRQARLGIASTKSLPLANEYKKLLNEQYQRLWTKHQQDLDLIDDVRSYVKARLSIERDYTAALIKLGKNHSNHITKKFSLLSQCDPPRANTSELGPEQQMIHDSEASDSRLQKRLANNGLDEPDSPCSLYKVWSEHITRLLSTAKNRADQFEQLIMVVDKSKDIRSHKATIGKKCLDSHLKRIHEDVLISLVELEKARKIYYEDESQAKKARENEEKIKKKRSGILTKFTDLQAKKEKTSAQREANDIQSTQARNDYIMALAAANAHLEHYFQRDLKDFMSTIDDGLLDHCKVFMATLSECDINSLKDSLAYAQYWSKMINLTGSQRTNLIFLDCEQSICLREKDGLVFEPCNNDQIHSISLEHNADYALQHEIDKWFTWFKKECRNLSQLVHQLEQCQRAFAEGKKSIEINGQTTEDIESKMIELKQQIRKSEAAKLKAQARLKVIREGGMQIEEWSVVESEIRADMARAQAELDAKRPKEIAQEDSSDGSRRDIGLSLDKQSKHQGGSYIFENKSGEQVKLEISKDSDDSDEGDQSMHNLASVSRSASNIMQKQQNAISGYTTLTDPSLVWQDDYTGAWGTSGQSGNYNVVVTDAGFNGGMENSNSTSGGQHNTVINESDQGRYDLLEASQAQSSRQNPTSMTAQSSSPLSAIVDVAPTSTSPYQGMMGEAYKSDYECDYNRNFMRSTASSVETYNQYRQNQLAEQKEAVASEEILDTELDSSRGHNLGSGAGVAQELANESIDVAAPSDEITSAVSSLLNNRVIALYDFDKTNEDDLSFNENDILEVTEINDANWVKAKNVTTKKEGYIPVSYVTLLDAEQIIPDPHTTTDPSGNSVEISYQTIAVDDLDLKDQHTSKPYREESRCKALYDYVPEEDTFEDDGLPHLSLIAGELMWIIDQGEDDGWWLVEKEEGGTRGHVPSMLVEELDSDPQDEDHFDGDDEIESPIPGDRDPYPKAMPSFEPPVFQRTTSCETSESQKNDDEVIQTALNDMNNNECQDEKDDLESNAQPGVPPNTSLLPTSFIIVEPTPEVESKSLEESIAADSSNANRTEVDCQIGTHNMSRTSTKPPADVSYSVINEDFKLEGPSRKPYQHSIDQVQLRGTPVIPEENIAEEALENVDNSFRTVEENYEPLSEVDSLDMPAPPSVVIEGCEDKRRSDDSADERDEEDERSVGDESSNSPSYEPKEIRHTGNVDVNPILRMRAEEFSMQIIGEALSSPAIHDPELTSTSDSYDDCPFE